MFRRRSTPILVLAIAATSLLYLFSFDPLTRPSMFDPATWEHLSLGMLEGRVPYRDVFLHKTPGAAFVGMAGGAVADKAGAPPLVGVRLSFLLLGAVAPALVFVLCLRAGSSRPDSLAAAIWLLAFAPWTLGSIEGARPKIATTTFGLGCLAFAPQYPFLAGVLGSLSALCWQPGGVFLLAAAGEIWVRLRDQEPYRSRVLAILRMCAGACLPAFGLLAYLASQGALGEFFSQTIEFNLRYVQRGARAPIETFSHLGSLFLEWNRAAAPFAPVALLGLLKARRNFPRGLAAATGLYLALTFVSLQAWPDIILFGPGFAAAMALGLAAILRMAVRPTIAAVAVILLALPVLSQPASGRFRPPVSLAEQRAFMESLALPLSSNDSVYVVSCPEFLIHTKRYSVLPWPYMWFGVDQFASDHTEGGFDAILSRLESQKPRLMLVCRRWNGSLRKRFEEWAAPSYTREILRYYPHTRRPMVMYRRVR